jgi:hypothetical protein
MSRPPSIRARILIALTDQPIGNPQLADRAAITARRRGEVVKLACDVLEGEGLVERVGGRHPFKWRIIGAIDLSLQDLAAVKS